MTPLRIAELSGEWRSLDRVLNKINSVDVTDMDGLEVKKFIYHLVFDMRPAVLEEKTLRRIDTEGVE